MKEKYRTLFALTVMLAAAAQPICAQVQKTAVDPFAELHARLLQASDSLIEKIHNGGQDRLSKPLAGDFQPNSRAGTISRIASNGEPAILSGATSARLNVARAKLLAFGVDAERIFIEEGVPLEFLLIAEVESDNNPLALSPRGARGLWQLMPATATRFGLRVDERLDERIQPERATRAAARYLRKLYSQFGDWTLALAAYNAGESRVAEAVERGRTQDFWRLSDQRLLPEETRRYVPAVLRNVERH